MWRRSREIGLTPLVASVNFAIVAANPHSPSGERPLSLESYSHERAVLHSVVITEFRAFNLLLTHG